MDNINLNKQQINSCLGSEVFAISETKPMSWWEKRTNLEKRWLLSALLTSMTTILLSFLIIIICSRYEIIKLTSPIKKIIETTLNRYYNINAHTYLKILDSCFDEECIKTASDIMDNRDTSYHPCDNFYRYSCGNWIKKNPVPDDMSQYSIIDQIEDNIIFSLKVILETSRKNEFPIFKLVKHLYEQCLDEDSIEADSEKILRSLLSKVYDWPVAKGDKWQENKFHWTDMLVQFRNMGFLYDQLFTIDLATDPTNSTRYLIQLRHPSIAFPISYLNHDHEEIFKDYFDSMVNVALLYGGERFRTEIEMYDVLEFEKSLGKVAYLDDNKIFNRNKHQIYTLQTLTDLTQEINWKKLLSDMFGPLEIDENIIIPRDFDIVAVSELIRGTKKRVLANYLIWKVIRSSLSFMGKNYRKFQQEYVGNISVKDINVSRWRICIHHLYNLLTEALLAMYIQNDNNNTRKKHEAESVTYSIHKEFIKSIDTIDWMDEQTKRRAKEKLNALHFEIGYPKALRSTLGFRRLYKEIKISLAHGYFQNVHAIKRWRVNQSFKLFRRKNNRKDWTKYSHMSLGNIDNNLRDNAIIITFGMLHQPLFDIKRPSYLNYGGFGSMLGHEIAHTLDHFGQNFDQNGGLNSWWSNETFDKYKTKANCFNNLFSSEQSDFWHLIDEMIADVWGVTQALSAYKVLLKEKKESYLPGLHDYTVDQLFWISYSNVWCTNMQSNNETLTPEARVNFITSNSQHFKKAFNCSSSDVYSKNICKIL